MGAGHSHGTATGAHRSRLLTALLITLTVMGAEVIGGLISGSLALLADAAHMLTDAAGVGLALLAAWFASRPATPERTFGYQRSEVLAAVVNALLLFGVAGFVLVEAVRRFTSPPPEVATGLMLGVAVVGLVANTISLLVLRGGQQESLNVRGAYLEVLGDLLGSAAVIVAAIVIALTGYTQADPIASALIGLMILPRTWGLLREAVDVLLEATPGVLTSPRCVSICWTLPASSTCTTCTPGPSPAACRSSRSMWSWRRTCSPTEAAVGCSTPSAPVSQAISTSNTAPSSSRSRLTRATNTRTTTEPAAR